MILRNAYNRSKDIEDKLKRDEARTNYKNICKVKFHTCQEQQTTALYGQKYPDPKSYWKKIKPRNQKVQIEISLQSFKEHFKSVYTINTTYTHMPRNYTRTNGANRMTHRLVTNNL